MRGGGEGKEDERKWGMRGENARERDTLAPTTHNPPPLFSPPLQAVTGRLKTLTAKPPADTDRPATELDDVLDAFFGVFCRRCRIFNCRLHGERLEGKGEGGGLGHPRMRPMPSILSPA